MKNFFRSFSKWDYLFFAICGIAYFFLIRQYIPCVEDLIYRFSKVDETPIQSLRDAIVSQMYDYIHLNGRFLVHVLVQWFCGSAGFIPFYITSSIMFSLLIMGMTWIVRYKNVAIVIDKVFITLCLLLCIPLIGMTYLGHISFVVNYLWSSAIYIWFIARYMYLKNEEPKYKIWQSMFLYLFAFIAGTWQESFSIGIAGALLIYHLRHLKETKGILLYYLLFFAIGALIGIFAPGNFVRFQSTLTTEPFDFSFVPWLAGKLYGIKMLVKHNPSITLFVALCILIPILQRKNTWNFLKNNYVWLIGSCIMFVFGGFLVAAGDHMFVSIGVFSAIVLYNLLRDTFSDVISKYSKPIYLLAVICLLIIYFPSYHYREKLCDANTKMEQSILTSTDSIACSAEIEYVDRIYVANSFWRRYTNLFFIHWNYSIIFYHQWQSKFLNPDYQRNTNVALPETKETIMSHCTEENKLSEYVYNSPRLEYIIVKIPTERILSETYLQIGTLSISYVDKLKDKLKRRMNHEKYSISPLESPVFKDYSRWFVDGENRYVIVCKPTNRRLVSASII